MNNYIKVAPIQEQEITYCSEMGWYDIRIPTELVAAVERHYMLGEFTRKPLYLAGKTPEDTYNELLRYVAGCYHKL